MRIKIPVPLAPGEHVLAISLHNHDCWSKDMRLAGVRLVGLSGSDPTVLDPGSMKLDFADVFRRTGVKVAISPPKAEWRWLHPLDGVDPAVGDRDFHQTFYAAEFDDSDWAASFDSNQPGGGFGYGNKDWFEGIDIGTPSGEATAEGRRSGKTAYFRHRFATAERLKHVTIRCRRDDGVIVYLDGREVGRNNMRRGEEAYRLAARKSIGGDAETELVLIRLAIDWLEPGEHVLAITLHNTEEPSSDLHIGGITLFGALAASEE
jgi:hypothetical protein